MQLMQDLHEGLAIMSQLGQSLLRRIGEEPRPPAEFQFRYISLFKHPRTEDVVAEERPQQRAATVQEEESSDDEDTDEEVSEVEDEEEDVEAEEQEYVRQRELRQRRQPRS